MEFLWPQCMNRKRKLTWFRTIKDQAQDSGSNSLFIGASMVQSVSMWCLHKNSFHQDTDTGVRKNLRRRVSSFPLILETLSNQRDPEFNMWQMVTKSSGCANSCVCLQRNLSVLSKTKTDAPGGSSQFLIGTKACSTGGSSHPGPCTWLKVNEVIEPREEAPAVALLNGHVVSIKLPSK